jgi:C1A family cysteine protease
MRVILVQNNGLKNLFKKCYYSVRKNSWGPKWGLRGYARIVYGAGKIEMYASYNVTTK